MIRAFRTSPRRCRRPASLSPAARMWRAGDHWMPSYIECFRSMCLAGRVRIGTAQSVIHVRLVSPNETCSKRPSQLLGYSAELRPVPGSQSARSADQSHIGCEFRIVAFEHVGGEQRPCGAPG